jgi:hypothetical protein
MVWNPPPIGYLSGMAKTPKTGSAYTYSSASAADPALADLPAGTEVKVNDYDKSTDQVRIGWNDATGVAREAMVSRNSFDGSFQPKNQ